MRSDLKTRCPAPGRLSNRTPLMSRPAALRAVIGHGDLAPQCEVGFLDNGFRCALPAAAADASIRELFHVCYWLAHTYARGAKPSPRIAFDASLVAATAMEKMLTLVTLNRKHYQMIEGLQLEVPEY